MSTYLHPTQESGFDNTIVSPDMSFLSTQQGKANQQYQTGLDTIKSAHSAILNQSITDVANTAKREEYLKQANTILHELGQSNVADQKNVNKALEAFAPFWSDDVLLQDINLTKLAKAEMQKATNAENSKDEDIRDTYDARSLGPINYAIEKLKNANRNPDVYKSLSIPKWTPFVKVDKKINQWYTDTKPSLKWDELDPLNPGRLIKHTNGPATLPGWKGMVGSQVGNLAQYNVLGQNEFVEHLKNFQATHPGASEADFRNYGASELLPKLIFNAKIGVDDATFEYNKIKKDITDLTELGKKNKGLTDVQYAHLEQLNNKIKAAGDSKKEVEDYYSKFTDSKTSGETLINVGRNLENFYGQNIRHDEVNKLATGFAQNETIDYAKDEVFFARADINLKTDELKLKQQHERHEVEQHDKENRLAEDRLEVDRRNADTNRMKVYADNPDYDPNNVRGGGIPGANPSGTASEVAAFTTPLQKYTESKAKLSNTIVSGLWGPEGLAIQALPNIPSLADNSTAVLDFSEVMEGYMNHSIDVDAAGNPVVFDKDKLANFNLVKGELIKDNGKAPKTMDELNDLILGTFGKMGGDNHKLGKDLDKTGALYTKYLQINASRNKYNTDEAEKDKKIQEEMAKNPGKYNTAIKLVNGHYQPVTPEMMSSSFPPISFKGPNGLVHYTSDEVAKMWADGTFDETISTKKGHILQVGNKKSGRHSIPSMNDNEMVDELNKYLYGTYSFTDNRGVVHTKSISGSAESQVPFSENSAAHKYGRSGNIKTKLEKINTDIIPNLSYYKAQTTEIGQRESIPITGKYAGNVRYITQTLTPDNHGVIYRVNSEGIREEVVDVEEKEAIRSVFGKPNVAAYVGTEVYHDKSGFNGKDMMEFSVTGDAKVAGDDVNEKIKGNRYYVENSDKSFSNGLLSKVERKYEAPYDELTDPTKPASKHTESSNSIEEQNGIRTKIRARGTEGVYVTKSRRDIDKKTGLPIWTKPETDYIPFSRRTLVETRADLETWKKDAVSTAINNQKTYNTNNKH